MKRVPPIGPLHAFMTVARTGGFGAAAKELNLSQSSVSRQIARLEHHFRCTLFERHTRRVVITDAGKQLLPFAERMLQVLNDAEKALGAPQNILTIRVHPTLAARWLLPRLSSFYHQYPDIRLMLDTRSIQMPDFSRDAIDAMIDFGAAPWPQLHTALLWNERMVPVCKPGLLPPYDAAHSLAGHLLLHPEPYGCEWSRWAAQADVSLEGARHQYFDLMELAILAAQQGQGIVLADSVLIADLLDRAELVQPFSTELETGLCYSLVFPQEPAAHEPLAAFRTWLLEQAVQTHSQAKPR